MLEKWDKIIKPKRNLLELDIKKSFVLQRLAKNVSL